jgi:hypothetical protein
VTLKNWLDKGWLSEHRTNSAEIAELMMLADRDLKDCQAGDLSPHWKLAIAYNAALQMATAALSASGYRASHEAHHYRIIQSLRYTVKADPHLVVYFDKFRKKRNIGGYERAWAVSDKEATEMFALAIRLRQEIEDWLRKNHPDLFETENCKS